MESTKESMLRHMLGYLAVICLTVMTQAAIAAEAIVPSPKLPASTPWNLMKLSETPMVEWIDAKGPVRSLLYGGEPYGGKPTRVFAYYATPATLGVDVTDNQRFPAVVLLHGGGGTAYREWAQLWAKRGYAAIAMDLTGRRPPEGADANESDRVPLEDGGPGQGEEVFNHVDKDTTEQWSYHAVADAIRAHSLIQSFPEVDPDRTAITGISWGGYLTSIVAGLDNRFKAAVPVYGCGFLHENSAWLKNFAKMTPAQQDRWVQLWDPSNYLPAVTMPILFINGTNDAAYPLDSYMRSYSLVPGSKQLCIKVNMPHSHPDGWAPTEIGRFIDSYLREGRPLTNVGNTEITDEQIKLHYVGAEDVTSQLHFTTDKNAINKRTWQTGPTKVMKEHVVADAPPPDATAWFISITDDEKSTTTSEVIFNNKP